ncbi:hypothetical protein IQ37_16875 [Chryseobacterium piperi]|uniref:Lipoprotein n=1 Tax=Chryseobacterium piperi TaxID=558152 RepID=A0A086AMH1_9FLAO|nr:hypothetical protein [Chryseobacterium piperi]ASW73096.1 hypothetical protein CJF12_01530 [Chryseobacterium piperi]KFF17885.1 hypothetical protein IQ37_16875 [Chryseobacterium piperi]
MRKNLYLIIILFSLVSCYTYQVKKQADTTVDNKKKSNESVAQQPPAPINIQEKLAPNKNVRIDVDGKTYKVIVDRWENDSLVAHPVHNANKILKFHKSQINAERIAEKRFSQPIADIITVVAYASAGVLIWSLVK